MSNDALQARLDSLDAKIDRIVGALFGGIDEKGPTFSDRVRNLEKEQARIAASLAVVEKAGRNFGLVEKIVFGVIALALTGIALALIKLVVGG